MALGLSNREAARAIGCTHTAINEARKAGRIPALEDGTIALDAVKAWHASRRAPRGGSHGKVSRPAEAASVDGEAAAIARDALAATLSPGGVFATRAEAELARDSYAAHSKRLQYERDLASVLDRKDVRLAVTSAAAACRTRLLAIPAEKSPAISRLKTVAQIEACLRQVITEALEELAEALEKVA